MNQRLNNAIGQRADAAVHRERSTQRKRRTQTEKGKYRKGRERGSLSLGELAWALKML